jgi:hypothetical protein
MIRTSENEQITQIQHRASDSGHRGRVTTTTTDNSTTDNSYSESRTSHTVTSRNKQTITVGELRRVRLFCREFLTCGDVVGVSRWR